MGIVADIERKRICENGGERKKKECEKVPVVVRPIVPWIARISP